MLCRFLFLIYLKMVFVVPAIIYVLVRHLLFLFGGSKPKFAVAKQLYAAAKLWLAAAKRIVDS